MKKQTIVYVGEFIGLALLLTAASWLLAQTGFMKQVRSTTPVESVKVYLAKKIITLEPSFPTATAVAVDKGRIVAVGSLTDVKSALGDKKWVQVDTLKDKVIVPGLIDQHLHPFLGALTLSTEVIATEDWILPDRTFKAAYSAKEYLDRLKKAEAKIKDPKEWLFSWGYHRLWHGQLNRQRLDSVSVTRPIVIWQRSCHEFYLNTAALKALGLSEKALQGKGTASKMASWAEGHFWETGLNLILKPLLKVFATPQRMIFGLRQFVTYLHQKGVTAYNEPGALYTPEIWTLYQTILGANETPFYSYFIVDGRAQVDSGLGLAESLADTEKQVALAGQGKVSFFPRHIKLFADGAIISQLMQLKEGYLDGHQGEWLITPEKLEERARLYWNAGYQIHIHVNGDLGLETVVTILEKLQRENPRADHRTVLAHFAVSTELLIDRIGRLGALVSANPYYPIGFAEKYSQSGLGPARAEQMVRTESVLKRNIPLSFHSDMPMAPSDPLFLAWCAVNRLIPSGKVVGPEQRITVEKALRAVTIEAAYSWRKENELGSIRPGKIANFTLLEQDPFTIAPTQLKDLRIWGTIFEGRLFPLPDKFKRTLIRRNLPPDRQQGLAPLQLNSGHHPRHSGQCDICTVSRQIARVLFKIQP